MLLKNLVSAWRLSNERPDAGTKGDCEVLGGRCQHKRERETPITRLLEGSNTEGVGPVGKGGHGGREGEGGGM